MVKKRISIDATSSSTKSMPSSNGSFCEHALEASVNVKKGCLKIKSQHESLGQEGVKKDPNQRSIKFAQIEFREHSQVLGDHPCVSSGAPIALSWEYYETPQPCLDLDTYENCRPHRRTKYELRAPPSTRELLLVELGYSFHEIDSTIHQCQKDRKSIEVSARDNANIVRRLLSRRTSIRRRKMSSLSQRKDSKKERENTVHSNLYSDQ